LEKAVVSFCKGVHGFGPFHDLVLQYGKRAIEMPREIFLAI
jgi:hypothetical protein